MACSTDFSQHNIGKIAFIMSAETNQYLAMKIWDQNNLLINHTTFWTGPYDSPTYVIERELPDNRAIIGFYSDTSDFGGI